MKLTRKRKNNGFQRLLLAAFFCVLFLNSSAHANVVFEPPPPQKVLIISTGIAFIDTTLAATLSCFGATVTVIDVGAGSTAVQTALTAAVLTLSMFDQVWDARWPSTGNTTISGPYTTPGSDENLYYNYMAGGGSMYMMFEYIDLARYNSVVDFMDNVVSKTPV